MATPRKRGNVPQTVQTPAGPMKVKTFGPSGETGWDIWVPAMAGITVIRRSKPAPSHPNGGTLIRIVPDGATP